MFIQRLVIQNFRNLQHLELETVPNFNLISGPNGAGKTSVLEAICYLALGRSFRNAGNQYLVQQGQNTFSLFAQIQEQVDSLNSQTTIGMSRTRGEDLIIKVNTEPLTRRIDLVDHICVQMIHPQGIELITKEAEGRRNFVDWGVYYSDPEFKHLWLEYRKALKQRNALLVQNGVRFKPRQRRLQGALSLETNLQSPASQISYTTAYKQQVALSSVKEQHKPLPSDAQNLSSRVLDNASVKANLCGVIKNTSLKANSDITADSGIKVDSNLKAGSDLQVNSGIKADSDLKVDADLANESVLAEQTDLADNSILMGASHLAETANSQNAQNHTLVSNLPSSKNHTFLSHPSSKNHSLLSNASFQNHTPLSEDAVSWYRAPHTILGRVSESQENLGQDALANVFNQAAAVQLGKIASEFTAKPPVKCGHIPLTESSLSELMNNAVVSGNGVMGSNAAFGNNAAIGFTPAMERAAAIGNTTAIERNTAVSVNEGMGSNTVETRNVCQNYASSLQPNAAYNEHNRNNRVLNSADVDTSNSRQPFNSIQPANSTQQAYNSIQPANSMQQSQLESNKQYQSSNGQQNQMPGTMLGQMSDLMPYPMHESDPMHEQNPMHEPVLDYMSYQNLEQTPNHTLGQIPHYVQGQIPNHQLNQKPSQMSAAVPNGSCMQSAQLVEVSQYVGSSQSVGETLPFSSTKSIYSSQSSGSSQPVGSSLSVGSILPIGSPLPVGSTQSVGSPLLVGSTQHIGASQYMGSSQTIGTSLPVGLAQPVGANQSVSALQHPHHMDMPYELHTLSPVLQAHLRGNRPVNPVYSEQQNLSSVVPNQQPVYSQVSHQTIHPSIVYELPAVDAEFVNSNMPFTRIQQSASVNTQNLTSLHQPLFQNASIQNPSFQQTPHQQNIIQPLSSQQPLFQQLPPSLPTFQQDLEESSTIVGQQQVSRSVLVDDMGHEPSVAANGMNRTDGSHSNTQHINSIGHLDIAVTSYGEPNTTVSLIQPIESAVKVNHQAQSTVNSVVNAIPPADQLSSCKTQKSLTGVAVVNSGTAVVNKSSAVGVSGVSVTDYTSGMVRVTEPIVINTVVGNGTGVTRAPNLSEEIVVGDVARADRTVGVIETNGVSATTGVSTSTGVSETTEVSATTGESKTIGVARASNPSGENEVIGYGRESTNRVSGGVEQTEKAARGALGVGAVRNLQPFKSYAQRAWSSAESEFAIWNEAIADLSERITQKRLNYLADLQIVLQEIIEQFLPNFKLKFELYFGWDKSLDLRSQLAQNLEKERGLGYTLYGCHRADLKIKNHNLAAGATLSRGQLKMLVYAMRLAQGMLLKQQSHRSCIYLIDDLNSELDENSQRRLLNTLIECQHQVFISNIQSDFRNILIPRGRSDIKVFSLDQGRLVGTMG